MLRNLMLSAAESPLMVRLFSSMGKSFGLASRFVAGEELGQAVEVVKELNRARIVASLDLLGEGVTDPEAARRATESYIGLLEAIADSAVDSNISIKLTQLGLDIDRDLCSANLGRILDRAEADQNFVRIDMESSEYTAVTLELFEQHLARYGPRRVGVVIQSYLYRSEEDVQRLSRLGCNIRLCKGAYMEPPEVAFPKKAEVDANFVKLLEVLLKSPSYTAIASHDQKMIDHARRVVAEQGISGDRYEFQMLYGVRRDYQLQLVQDGFRMRVYVPFGTEWAPYLIRRLAERPANLLFFTRAIFKK